MIVALIKRWKLGSITVKMQVLACIGGDTVMLLTTIVVTGISSDTMQ